MVLESGKTRIKAQRFTVWWERLCASMALYSQGRGDGAQRGAVLFLEHQYFPQKPNSQDPDPSKSPNMSHVFIKG